MEDGGKEWKERQKAWARVEIRAFELYWPVDLLFCVANLFQDCPNFL